MSSSGTTGIGTVNEADVALPVCIPGLQGLPIQITGWTGLTERKSIVVSNDIHCQFVKGMNNLQSNTFFMNGTQYFVSEIDITQPKQEGLLDSSIKPFGEIHIWGKPTTTTLEQSTIALMIIPISESSDGNETGRNIENISGLSDILPVGKDVDIVKYTTCVETQSSSVIVHVAYWTVGIIVRTQYKNRSFTTALRKFGIPISLLNGEKVLTTFQQYNDEHRTKTARVYKMSSDGNYSIPYSISILLSATSPEFQKGFRLIKDFSIEKAGESTNLDTSSYKCIAINRSRDIKDGRLTVDPRTGKTLTEENKEAETVTNATLYPNKDISSDSAYLTVLTILGVILGCCGIALIIFFIQYLVSTRSTAGLPPVSPQVQATATLAATGLRAAPSAPSASSVPAVPAPAVPAVRVPTVPAPAVPAVRVPVSVPASVPASAPTLPAASIPTK